MISNTNKKGQKKGFTLVEMLVATILFLVAMTASISIFMSTVRANQKITAMQKVENEIRYIMEVISKEVRLGTIHYDDYEEAFPNGFINPVSTLALEDNADNVSYFALNGDEGSPGIVQISLDGIDWSDLNTDSVFVDSLDFYLLPKENPFRRSAYDIKQPMVIINLEAHHDQGIEGKIRIQTAVSSRQYEK